MSDDFSYAIGRVDKTVDEAVSDMKDSLKSSLKYSLEEVKEEIEGANEFFDVMCLTRNFLEVIGIELHTCGVRNAPYEVNGKTHSYYEIVVDGKLEDYDDHILNNTVLENIECKGCLLYMLEFALPLQNMGWSLKEHTDCMKDRLRELTKHPICQKLTVEES